MVQSNAIIINFSEKSERICSSAARISTTSGNAYEIFANSVDANKNKNLITKVLRSGHKTIIEHAYFTIAFSNVSAIVEQFMIEFRLASFTVKSRRYVNFRSLGYFIPNKMEKDLKEEYIKTANYLFLVYDNLLDLGIPKEDARFILPYCFRSNFYCTVNARELIHIIKEIKYGRGKHIDELQNLAEQIMEQINTMFPSIYQELSKESKLDYNSCDTFPIPGETNFVKGYSKILYYDNNILERMSAAYRIQNPLTNKDEKEIINEIVYSSRARDLEQSSVTFVASNLSLSSLTHLERHRMQSIVIPSIFTVPCGNFIFPDTIYSNSKAREIYIEAINCANKFREKLILNNDYNQIYFCLGGNTINVLTTMNLRELRTYFSLRCCNRAQWEIRQHANDVLMQLRKVCPDIFNKFGASCTLYNFCPEGSMTCGHPQFYKKERI